MSEVKRWWVFPDNCFDSLEHATDSDPYSNRPAGQMVDATDYDTLSARHEEAVRLLKEWTVWYEQSLIGGSLIPAPTLPAATHYYLAKEGA